MARLAFLAPSATSFYPDLVGELSTRSEAFRTGWAVYDVRLHHPSVKHFQHPAVCRLDLKLLASWAAIVNRAAAGP